MNAETNKVFRLPISNYNRGYMDGLQDGGKPASAAFWRGTLLGIILGGLAAVVALLVAL